ncbi:XrtA/PEP-CTERM system histidine kinase PrsK [Marinagarivorans algicola]|uniref:XrtA/PEP-CTERM system histidine kinase PrsK n=1 Tax=Marinagarivorans algicola TaxID=1513270 RepID=UPI0006B8EDA4|nr:XrtA/PEP-CTERM system histidine kinase PrsK [Marinagarivorans algicola]
MTYNSATFIAYLGASVFSIILIFAFASQLRAIALRPAFALAAAAQSTWLLSASYTLANPNAEWLHYTHLLDTAQQFFWLWALIQAMQKYCHKALPISISRGFIPLSVAIFSAQLLLSRTSEVPLNIIFSMPSAIINLIGLLFIHRLYCSASNARLLKLICLALGVTLCYTCYHSIIQLSGFNDAPALSSTRATITLISNLALLFGALTLPKENTEHHASLSLSRPVILYLCLLSLSAAIITVFALASLYIRRFGGGIGEVMYLFVVAASIVAVVMLLTSTGFRSLLNVLINKHLFSHKYDYRSEWLKLIDGLSKPANGPEALSIAINAVMAIFKSSGGALYLPKGDQFHLALGTNISDSHKHTEPQNSSFSRVLREFEWVFFPRLAPTQTQLDRFNETLPDWIRLIDDVWLVMPLIYETKLTGFIILSEPKLYTSLNWEDLDLLKITGRQIASYIEGHRKSEALSEAKQFETFNKLSAFIMHDLKNLIAQQSLLVENAAKHKGNPAFIEDAFSTIGSSVDRLNVLLQKLQRSEPEAARRIDLKPVLIEALSRCSRVRPTPSLRLEADHLKLLAAPDTLCMVFVHLIQNAQEATQACGFVDIHIKRTENSVIIAIDDNGKGMDEYFIKHSLFKPFETTKTGKGMGIGVYQAKDYLEHLGGSITVESKINEGTTFTITLPLLTTP